MAEPSYWGNLGRSVIEGLTFNNEGEIEAALRALAAQRNLNFEDLLRRYRTTKNNVEGDYQKWGDKNPLPRLGGEFIGALAPGVVGAFVPGGQVATGVTAARGAALLPRVARVMAEPVTVAMERYAPRVAANLASRGPLARLAIPLADETLTGAVQSVGSAKTLGDAPRQIVEEAPTNVVGSLVVRGMNWGGKRALAARRARRAR